MNRPRRKRNNSYQGLIVLIGILAAVLIVMLIVSSLVSGPDTPQEDPGTSGAPSESVTDPGPIAELVITAPAKTQFATIDDQILFQGTADVRGGLTISGTAVEVGADGSFAHSVELVRGVNEIVVSYLDQTVTYSIEQRYAVETFSPAGDVRYGCGATIQVAVSARSGSSVSVTLNDKTIPMEVSADQMGSGVAEGFVLYTGTYKLPNTNTSDLDLGKITYTVTCDGVTETYNSGTITASACGEVLASDPSVTPGYGEYVDVGSGYIVEIVANSAESFLTTTGDKSIPALNYLPKGTVDYGSVADIQAKGTLVKLRCGRQVYLKEIKNYPPAGNKSTVVDCYQGTLPDHNELSVAGVQQSNDYTILVLDTMWKAPFLLDLLPQDYTSESQYDYSISSFTAEYVEITFCYATVFEGEVKIPSDNPLFSRAELTQNASDCTLRLYLKKTGGFYGWDAYYNDADQLCFRFINPKTVSKTNANRYGADLTGIRIVIDVGHGGDDGGAAPKSCEYDEAALNLQLSLKLKAELESMGATVIMNRTTDTNISVQERIGFLKEQAPDLCIAIHQNSSESTSYNGGWVCYYTQFSLKAASYILAQTEAVDVYQKTQLNWNKYFVARETVCPVVLMENGFMSNASDYAGMIDEDTQLLKVQAMAQGIANYFLSISK